jgi:branched-chain amino acid transport system substrate-binding protein
MRQPSMIGLLLSVVLFVAGFGVTGALGAVDPYPLGVALGLTGTGAPYSKEAVEGAEMAVNEINARGGLLGRHPIRLLIRDTRTRPEEARKVVGNLIRAHRVACVIGTYSSACALAVKTVCRDNGVLHIAPISNSEQITKADPSPYTFSVVPNTYMMAKAVVLGVNQLARSNGWKRYVTIASDYAWGRSSQEIQVDLMRETAPDIQLAAAYWPRLGQTRFNSFLVDIQARKPDFLLGSIAGSDNSFWLRDARDYRLFKTVAAPGGLISVTELIGQASSLRRGAYGRSRAPFFAHLDQPRMVHFVGNYRAKFGRYPSDWAVLTYDAVHILAQGVEKAGRTGSDAVKEALTGAQVDTTRGRFAFRPIDNQLSCSAYFGRVADDGEYEFPIYHNLMVLKGSDIWRPESEIRAARGD